MTNDSREAFEKWVSQQPFTFSTKTYLSRYDSGDYEMTTVRIAWDAWQARDAEVAALQARVQELEDSYRSCLAIMTDEQLVKLSLGKALTKEANT